MLLKFIKLVRTLYVGRSPLKILAPYDVPKTFYGKLTWYNWKCELGSHIVAHVMFTFQR